MTFTYENLVFEANRLTTLVRNAEHIEKFHEIIMERTLRLGIILRKQDMKVTPAYSHYCDIIHRINEHNHK